MTRPGAERGRRPPAPARPRASRERQRQRLIDACISALHVYGPSNTTVEKVVAIARMSPGIVRFYFESKAAMLVASLEYLAAEFEDLLIVPVGLMRATPFAALERLVEIYLGPEIASARKVSVWYSFWGEASSRQEYFDICGTRDERFELLVRELIGRLIEESQARHLDADAIALGLIGVLEVLWQSYAFQTESTIDRAGARRRAMAYLRSVFPRHFPMGPPGRAEHELPAGAYHNAALLEAERRELFHGSWQFIGLERELGAPGDYLALDGPGAQALLVRQPGGALRAFQNACGHRPHALSTARSGRFAGAIECKVHGRRYSLAGEPLEPAHGPALRDLELAAVGEFLFVRAPSDSNADVAAPAPLAAFAAERLGLAPAARITELEVAADWKLLVEHWLEDPAGERVPAADGGFETSGAIDPGSRLSERAYRAWLPADAPPRWQRSVVLPNQLIELAPGRVAVLQVLPVAAGRARLRSFAFQPARPDRTERALAYLAERLARVREREAAALASAVQKGLEAPGPKPAPTGEVPAPLADFRIKIARLLPAALQHSGDSP